MPDSAARVYRFPGSGSLADAPDLVPDPDPVPDPVPANPVPGTGLPQSAGTSPPATTERTDGELLALAETALRGRRMNAWEITVTHLRHWYHMAGARFAAIKGRRGWVRALLTEQPESLAGHWAYIRRRGWVAEGSDAPPLVLLGLVYHLCWGLPVHAYGAFWASTANRPLRGLVTLPAVAIAMYAAVSQGLITFHLYWWGATVAFHIHL